MVSSIDDIDIAERIAGNPPGGLELARTSPLSAPLGKEASTGIELLNAIIAFIGHEDIPDKVDGHAAREEEGAVEAPITAPLE